MKIRPSQASDIPHRFWVLSMLRSLATGHLLVVGAGTGSFDYFLDGLPHVAILFQYIHEHEWIREYRSQNGIRFYRITERGLNFLREGEQWWGGLRWQERLAVRYDG